MATRRYFVGSEERTIEELENVVAVRLGADAGHATQARSLDGLGTPVARAARGALAGGPIPGDVASAFARADWHLIIPDARSGLSRGADAVAEASRDTAHVFRRPDGTVALATNALTVQLDPGMAEADCEAALRQRSLEKVRRLGFARNAYEVRAIGYKDALEASEALQADPRFVFAEPELEEQVPGRALPDDPRYGEQWQWRNSLLSGADVHAEAAWDRTRGEGVRVAVIDNGFDAGHEDLAPNVDPASGSFRNDGSFAAGPTDMPGGRHGTFCAGMVGARADNGRGGCGAAPECSLMLIACLPDQVGTQATLARAVAYAADPRLENPAAAGDTGADIIACSLGPNGAVWELRSALRLALEFAVREGRGGLGCAIFWAVSNGRNVDVALDQVVSHSDVIAVGRSTRFDTEHDCARGPKLELLAPGVDVFSTLPGNTYGTGTGTSYAAPCAAGVAALVLSAALRRLTRDQLRNALAASCDKIGNAAYVDGRNDDHGFGRVNAEAAIAMADAMHPARLARGHAARQA